MDNQPPESEAKASPDKKAKPTASSSKAKSPSSTSKTKPASASSAKEKSATGATSKAKSPSATSQAKTAPAATAQTKSAESSAKTKSEKSGSKTNLDSDYAIVETSGQQFWLQQDRYYDLDRIKADPDELITLEKVLLVKDSKGTTVGNPYVKGASVKVKVMEHRRGPKLIVYKMRPKKKTRRKNGHRQELTRVMVQTITSK